MLEVAAALSGEVWSRLTIKEGSPGHISAEFTALWVSDVQDAVKGLQVSWVLHRHMEMGELKTYLFNAPWDTAMETQSQMNGIHFPIKMCVEESKPLLGMRDYEVRS